MSSFFTSLRRSVTNSLVQSGRVRARNELLRMNDRTLADAGFSRDLLDAGVHAWPWRTPVDTTSREQTFNPSAEILRAERELHSMSDRELDDLAIARADIPRAVRQGRVGVELPLERDQDYPAAA